MGPFYIYSTNSLCENLNYFIRIQTFCVLLLHVPHFSSNNTWGLFGVNFESKEVTAGFLQGTPGASVIQ